MGSDDWLDWPSVRHELKKPVRDVIGPLIKQGWRLKRAGHKFRLHCPCADDSVSMPIYGTPKNPDVQAKIVRDAVAKCPDRHDLLRRGDST